MGIMADRLNNMVVTVSSPDRQITAELKERDAVTVMFAEDTYPRYTERTLEYQLSRLATLLWTGYQRGYNAAVSEVMGYPVRENPEQWDANRRRFREEQAKTLSEGMSPGQRVYVQNTGMLNWHFVIRDGTIAKLDVDEFCAECVAAYHNLMSNYRTTMAGLRAKHYGPGMAGARPGG